MKALKIAVSSMLIFCASAGFSQNHGRDWRSHIVQQNEELGQISEGGLFRVKIEWQNSLLAGSLDNKSIVSFYDAYGAPKNIQMLSFKPFMVSMGHGSLRSSKLVMKQNPSEESQWNVENVFFSMTGTAGEWAIDIEGTFGGDKDRVRVLIPSAIVE